MNQFEGEKKGFQNPDEELAYLRDRLDAVEKREQERGFNPESTPVNVAKQDDIRAYQRIPQERVLEPEFRESEEAVTLFSLNLSPEAHDKQMAELMKMMQEKGVRNTLAVIEKMKKPHLEDDFHRFLVEYLREGYLVTGLKEKETLARSLNHTLFEIILPGQRNENNQRGLSEVLSSMEQLYAGLSSIATADSVGQPYYSLELALPSDTDQYSFYASVPNDKAKLFEKQVTSIYGGAQVIQQNDDYNIFSIDGFVEASYAESRGAPLYPIKTYEEFDHDPLNVILNSFSKLEKVGDGVAIQIILRPDSDQKTFKRYKSAKDSIAKGASVKEALEKAQRSLAGEVVSEIKSGIWDFVSNKKKDDTEEKKHEDTSKITEKIEKKISAPIMHTNIRLVASSDTEIKTKIILEEMESAFNQFENPEGNTLVFKRTEGRRKDKLVKDFTFRFYEPTTMIPLNLKELTTLMHLETIGVTSAHGLKETGSSVVPPPSGLAQQGILLGYNSYRGSETEIYMTDEDRLRHFYTIGQTGTGKTSLLKNMILQDIKNGDGVCLIDPHGVDVQDILSQIPPNRQDDVIYFDPSDVNYPMGLNMLEYDPEHPELKTFVVNEIFSIFQKLYAGSPESMGPMFEQYFRNATGLVIEDPESGSTLLDVSRVLSNKEFRDYKISRSKNPVINQFWTEIADKAGGEASLTNIVPYITSKFDVFLSNEIMRPIIAQEHSAFNFRDIMDSKKILLVNLSKGKLGDVNAHLLGMILVGKILMAALSRSDVLDKNLPPFYLYIDEFQNFTTNSIATILSEARKYKLSLNLAHQFIAQLDQSIKDAVFGNVGSLCGFRVGAEDAEFLESYFEPSFTASDLMNVNNHQAHLKMLVNGKPVKSFTLQTYPPEEGNPAVALHLKELSRVKYGGNREEIEAGIMQKYKAGKAV